MTYVHWVLFDLPPDTTEIVEGMVGAAERHQERPQRLEAHRLWRPVSADRPAPLFLQAVRTRRQARRPVGGDQGGRSGGDARARARRGADGRHLSEGRLGHIAHAKRIWPPLPCCSRSHRRTPRIPPRGFVEAKTLIPDLVVEMRYATARNFIGRPIPGYKAPRCFLTLPAAKALQCAADGLRQRGFAHQGLRLLSPAAGGECLRRLGPRPARPEDEVRLLPRRRQALAVLRELHRLALGPQPRQHRRPHHRAAIAPADGVRPGRRRNPRLRFRRPVRAPTTAAPTWAPASTASRPCRTRPHRR